MILADRKTRFQFRHYGWLQDEDWGFISLSPLNPKNPRIPHMNEMCHSLSSKHFVREEKNFLGMSEKARMWNDVLVVRCNGNEWETKTTEEIRDARGISSGFRNAPDTRLLVTIAFNSCEFPDRVRPRANRLLYRGTDRVIVTGCNPFSDG